jgi:hypothetical protein
LDVSLVVPVLALDTGSAPLKILVLAVIVAAILATRLGPRGRS